MFAFALVAALTAAPLGYQYRTFVDELTENGGHTGELSPAVLACLAGRITDYHPSQNPVDVAAVEFVRQASDHTRACVRWSVILSESIADFLARDVEPSNAWFSSDGQTVYRRERLDPVCVPRGSATSLVTCLSSYLLAPGQATHISASRQSLSDPLRLHYAWEIVAREASSYGQDRRSGRARSHVLERPAPPPAPEEPDNG